MADPFNCEPWDIPDPCHFESCPPPSSCGPCDAGNIFKHPHRIPGVPVGRVRIPLVRVNGQIQDLGPGSVISNNFVEPPKVSWDSRNSILNVGGRFVKLQGMNTMYGDCHGNAINACTPLMTCLNFSEIVNASTGVGFKNANNPFAGLTVFLAPNSGLTLNNNGLSMDLEAICGLVENCLLQKGWGPLPEVPTLEEIYDYVKGHLIDEGWGPLGAPPVEIDQPDAVRTIPLYACYENSNDEVGAAAGSITLNFYATAQVIIPDTPGPIVRYYSGTTGATNATYIGVSSDSGYSLGDFNNITMVTANIACDSGTPGEPPVPDPGPDTSPKTILLDSTCRGTAGASFNVEWSAGILTIHMFTFPVGNYTERMQLISTAYGIIKESGQYGQLGGGGVSIAIHSGHRDAKIALTASQYAALGYLRIVGCDLQNNPQNEGA